MDGKDAVAEGRRQLQFPPAQSKNRSDPGFEVSFAFAITALRKVNGVFLFPRARL
jgi:hypothetical protein